MFLPFPQLFTINHDLKPPQVLQLFINAGSIALLAGSAVACYSSKVTFESGLHGLASALVQARQALCLTSLVTVVLTSVSGLVMLSAQTPLTLFDQALLLQTMAGTFIVFQTLVSKKGLRKKLKRLLVCYTRCGVGEVEPVIIVMT